MANRVWTKNAASSSQNFNNIFRKYYNGDTKTINFSDVISASAEINQWVRQTTRNHIPAIVDPGLLSPDTQVLLTSALYFKGKWANSFDENLTKMLCFNIPNIGCQQVPMMESFGYFRYADVQTLGAKVIEIPYSVSL